jgi:hypothetical protein
MMVTEYIKRNQKMGYDKTGELVYKVPADVAAPVVVETVVEEELPFDEVMEPSK